MPYWKDIDITLEIKNNGDIKEDTDLDAITNSIINILNTLKGSRRMLPQFAVATYNLLFEQIDEITSYELGEQILDAINLWDDRIIVEEILVIPDYDSNKYDININIRSRNTGEQKEIEYILNKL